MKELIVVRGREYEYGIWKSDVSTIINVDTLHRIPLSPACIAGIASIEGSTVTIADLPACMGFPAAAEEKEKGRILMLKGSGRNAGFLINSDAESIFVEDDEIHPLPESVRTDFFSSCAVTSSFFLPILDISELYAKVTKTGSSVSSVRLSLPEYASDDTAPDDVRIFRLGGLLYASGPSALKNCTVARERMIRIPRMPWFLKGVASTSDGILPVIDVAQLIHHHDTEHGAVMLLTVIRESAFGLLVDEDCGVQTSGDVVHAELPLLARLPWLSAAVIIAGDIIPLIDIPKALSLAEGSPEDIFPDKAYLPDSVFSDLFKKQEIEVIEFSLLEARHALPKCEVENIVSFKTYRVLPQARAFVLGVAEHEGALLPVIDLALMFGRRSPASPTWSMIVVKNGAFRCLIPAETVFGERLLSLEVQCDLPIHIPHNVVYGCYPDSAGVSLILNVEALAVHFQKDNVQEMLPALVLETKQTVGQSASVIPEQYKGSLEHHEAGLKTDVTANLESVQYHELTELRVANASELYDEESGAATAAVVDEGSSSESGDSVCATAVAGNLSEEKAEKPVEEQTLKRGEISDPDPDEIVSEAQEETALVPNADNQEIPAVQAGVSKQESVQDQNSIALVPQERPKEQTLKKEEVNELEQGSPVSDEQRETLSVPDAAGAADLQAGVTEERSKPDQDTIALVSQDETEEPTLRGEEIAEPEQGRSTSEEQKETGSVPQTEVAEEKSKEEAPAHDERQPEIIVQSNVQNAEEQALQEKEPEQGSPVSEQQEETLSVRDAAAEASVLKAGGTEEASKTDQGSSGLVAEAEAEALKEEVVNEQEQGEIFSQERAQPTPHPKAHREISRIISPEKPEGRREEVSLSRDTAESATSRSWNRRALATAAVVVLGVFLYLVGTNRPPSVKKPEESFSPPVVESDKTRTQSPAAESIRVGTPPRSAGPTPTGPPVTAPKAVSRQSLMLEIPADRHVTIELYTVEKGDTLWSISRRFTGSPANYPRIASDSSIADPHLIFPGQKITLRRKAE